MTFSPVLSGALEAAVSAAAGKFRLERSSPVAGGCIHRCFVIEGGGRRYFVKLNERARLECFAAEADGLTRLGKAGARVPGTICHGSAGEQAFLVLEHLELRHKGDYAELGRMLAKVHALRGEYYGWHRHNFIGTTPQANPPGASWSEFWRDARLAPQLALAGKNGIASSLVRKGERLAAELVRLLPDPQPPPSLLHGDLWSGNAGFLPDGVPVLFDPAVYFGDREADIAMTELFGGFPREFYSAYVKASPLDAGYETRKILYNLYHVLNHANLFGAGYAAQAERMIERLLAELR
jgi:protein-ribulosamine 3-kinase